MASLYDKYVAELEARPWDFARDMPLMRSGTLHDPRAWENVHYLDYWDRIPGRPYGANGIGRLRETALLRPTEQEFDGWWADAQTYMGWKQLIVERGKPDLDRMIREQETYAALLAENGVEVHWVELPTRVGAFGPFNRPSAAMADLFVVRGGVIVGKYGSIPHNNGRAALLARWAALELGIPTLLTIHGTGVAEIGACVWLADDIFVTAISAAFNQEGLDQFIPVIKASRKGPVHVQVIQVPNYTFWDQATGACAHPNVVIGALDVGKVIIYPPGLDYGTHRWLRAQRFDIVEADHDEHVNHYACNILTLAPGKVMMHAGAKRAIAKVRALGVDVVEVELEAWRTQTNKIDCFTAKLRRDPGPALFEDR
jgi:N-dimethylarginine dimethylaminohydrolase